MRKLETKRTGRVADLIMREIAELLTVDIQDPRLNTVTVTGVAVQPDLKRAKVLYTARENCEEADAGLKSAQGYLRSRLSKRLHMRTVPELVFCRDSLFEVLLNESPTARD